MSYEPELFRRAGRTVRLMTQAIQALLVLDRPAQRTVSSFLSLSGYRMYWFVSVGWNYQVIEASSEGSFR